MYFHFKNSEFGDIVRLDSSHFLKANLPDGSYTISYLSSTQEKMINISYKKKRWRDQDYSDLIELLTKKEVN
jgi:hypothetical protein